MQAAIFNGRDDEKDDITSKFLMIVVDDQIALNSNKRQ
jgi:hypothetical protein